MPDENIEIIIDDSITPPSDLPECGKTQYKPDYNGGFDKNKCKKCQSFCMLGKQLVIADSSDKIGWKNWSNIKKDDTIQKCNSNDYQNGKLSAKDQNDLITFITNAYNKGKYNCTNLNKSIKECKMWNKLSVRESEVKYEDEIDDINKAQAGSLEVIKINHFNSFLKQLTQDSEPVSKMGKGEDLHEINNATSNGPVVGMKNDNQTFSYSNITMSPRESYSEQLKSNNITDKSLITWDLWKSLADRASKLMYHPYQCDMCNIYEGGEFPEVVRELGSAIQSFTPTIIYSWNRSTSVDVPNLGVTGIGFRQDCSGFVSACIGVYRMLTYGGKYQTCNMVSGNFTDSDSRGLGDVKDDFCSSAEGGNIGCIYADEDHVEASDDNGKVWSGGGCGPCLNGQPGNCHEHPQMMHGGCGMKPLTWVFAGSAGQEGPGNEGGTAPASWDREINTDNNASSQNSETTS